MPAKPETLGEHLKRRRLELHLIQSEVADRLGVHVESLKNWERGAASPTIRYIPKILEILGYDPEPQPDTLAGQIVHARRRLGLTQEELAQALGIDPVTLYRWEKGLSVPTEATLCRLQDMLSPENRFIPR